MSRASAAAMVRAILLLPGMVLVVIPAALLLLAAPPRWLWGLPVSRGWALLAGACVLSSAGLAFAIWTSRLFLRVGEGTPAPWDPPQRLVIQGPYRHVRNPMISSVFALLAAESLVFGSVAVVAWAVIFVLANLVYMPLSEEPGLERRFGDAYRHYKQHVPRWIPRRAPYEPRRHVVGASSSSTQKST